MIPRLADAERNNEDDESLRGGWELLAEELALGEGEELGVALGVVGRRASDGGSRYFRLRLDQVRGRLIPPLVKRQADATSSLQFVPLLSLLAQERAFSKTAPLDISR